MHKRFYNKFTEPTLVPSSLLRQNAKKLKKDGLSSSYRLAASDLRKRNTDRTHGRNVLQEILIVRHFHVESNLVSTYFDPLILFDKQF